MTEKRTSGPDDGPPLEANSVGVFSFGLMRTPHLRTLLGARRLIFRPTSQCAHGLDFVVGWGDKENTRVAQDYATRHGISYLRMEDGFLRSVGLGGPAEPPLSIVVDDLGIYYDATKPSRLEEMLNASEPVADSRMLQRARAAIGAIVEHGLSKYNHTTAASELPPARGRYRVLVVDQTYGDLSVKLGLADADSFATMLKVARQEHPDAEILVKRHPEVIAGRKAGYLKLGSEDLGAAVLSHDVNPIGLIRQVEHVYAVTSQLGFEALLVGKPVTLFGTPFYAGWGLTDDRAELPRRRARRTLEELFAATHIRYARYLDPDTEKICELERLIEHLTLQRRHFSQPAGKLFCFNFGPLERRSLRAYLRAPDNQVVFVRSVREIEQAGIDVRARLLLRADEQSADVVALATRERIPVWRVAGGLLSAGYMEEALAPTSLVLDEQGIYYDGTGPSDLEVILEQTRFECDELSRARGLRAALLRMIEQQNAGARARLRMPDITVPIALVLGQRPTTPCMKSGSVDITPDVALLKSVRAARPNAYLVYLPHPKDETNVWPFKRHEREARDHADRVLTRVSVSAALSAADEVHTVSSLAAFEAVLRALPVYTYGRPFYAGWGLTIDRHNFPRRTRRLSLDELVAGALFRYSRYVGLRSGRFTTPEVALAERFPELSIGGRGRCPFQSA